ncbi:hypothetical protein GCM10023219_09990 [Stakelama sediminis]|uniref:Uncharacterized protein n=1 Tax=Stakelama sediminis TaxID=463200 RepID=A0A840YVJ8_9SPHN|nr:hypothetical protein [Stakelama sediminis]MBB5717721.1 hypothetical protein [Stakelama sediminis]
MKRYMIGLALAFSAAIPMAAGQTSPQTTPDAKAAEQFNGYEDAAWTAMRADLAKAIPEHEASQLTLIAYHAVAEMLCDGVKMNMPKVTEATLALHPTNWDGLSAADQKQWDHTILVNYGMIVGVMLAEHADNSAPLCEDARSMIADEDNDWHYFATTATATID